jgi:hypothetical protein
MSSIKTKIAKLVQLPTEEELKYGMKYDKSTTKSKFYC